MRTVSAILFLLLAIGPAQAFDEVNKGFFDELALKGYDSTAYFDARRPESGREAFTFEWKGAVWRFARAEDRDRFAANPNAYAPQYGGYCSNQMSLGNLSDTDPHVWLIHDRKLYLFGHQAGRDRWERTGIEKQIREADRHWRDYLAGRHD